MKAAVHTFLFSGLAVLISGCAPRSPQVGERGETLYLDGAAKLEAALDEAVPDRIFTVDDLEEESVNCSLHFQTLHHP